MARQLCDGLLGMLRFLEGTCQLTTHSCYQDGDTSLDELCQMALRNHAEVLQSLARMRSKTRIYLLHENPKWMLLKALNKNSGHWEKGSTDLQLTHCEPFQTTQQGRASQVETDGVSGLRSEAESTGTKKAKAHRSEHQRGTYGC